MFGVATRDFKPRLVRGFLIEKIMSKSYKSWGFTSSPFKTKPLEASDTDEKLLIGRDSELNKLQILLAKTEKWTVVDGEIGSGKTSLINVATHKLYKKFLEKTTSDLLIPATKTIQIDESTTIESFCKNAYLIIAESIIKHQQDLSSHLLSYKLQHIAEVNKLLTNPVFSTIGGTAGPIGYTTGSTANESQTFSESGFNSLIQSWLEELFGEKTSTNGGIVIIIDNLELLKTSKLSREKLEQLRDPILTKTGIKWVLCGANGIISATASTRINGYLQKALHVSNIPATKSHEILESRINGFKSVRGTQYLPFIPENFHKLHTILSKNLRDLLGKIDSYNEEIMTQEEPQPTSDAEKNEAFEKWLSDDSEDARALAKRYSTHKSWKLLAQASEEGSFSSGEYEKFEFTQQQNFSAAIKELKELGLVDVISNEDDNRRKNISLRMV